MGVELITDGTRRARKKHQCYYCDGPIWKGEVYEFSTLKHDDIYTLRYHKDCRDATDFYMKFHGISIYDCDDGIQPLADQITDGGEFEIDCSILRGRFPHVVSRIEYADQKAAIRFGEWEMPQ